MSGKNKNENLKLTSVKIHKDISENFRVATARSTFNLQKLVNRAMDLYNTNPEFRNIIHSHSRLVTSGSI